MSVSLAFFYLRFAFPWCLEGRFGVGGPERRGISSSFAIRWLSTGVGLVRFG